MAQRNRDNTFSMRISTMDYELLNAKRNCHLMGKSEYIRNIILFASACERYAFSGEIKNGLLHELNKCGKRLNQVAHTVNLTKHIDSNDLTDLRNIYISLFEAYDRYIRDNVSNPF